MEDLHIYLYVLQVHVVDLFVNYHFLLQIPYFEWHSAELAEPEDKLQYLHELLSQSVSSSPGEATTPTTTPTTTPGGRWDPQSDMALNGLSGMQNADFVEDPLVMKVLHTFDRMGSRRT